MTDQPDPIAEVIHDTIDALPHAQRLYPDLYAGKIAAALRERGFIKEDA